MTPEQAATATKQVDEPSDQSTSGHERTLPSPTQHGRGEPVKLQIPVTGELRVDEALAFVAELEPSTPAETASTLGQVLRRLEQVLDDSQDTRSS
jgi:hypothetical protein